MTHLFLFTLGPVQSFIAQARKTQDLYAGSRLLSVLTDTAIKTVQHNGGNILFPKPDLASLPNRFIAKVDLPEKDLQGFGKKIEDAVRAEWERIAYNGLLEQALKVKNFTVPNGFKEQIRQHLEIYWVFTPIKDEPNGYQKAFQEIDRLLAGVKQTSYFEQNEEIGRKCSVDGQRNVKFYRRSQGQQFLGEDRIKETHLFATDNEIVDYEDNQNLALLQPGEGLSAVSLIKRAYREKYNENEQQKGKDEFESTADIALLSWQKHHQAAYANYRGQFTLKKGNKDFNYFNAQFLFEDNITKKQFEKQGLPEELIKKIPDLLASQRKLEGFDKKSTKYYAILLFDGDGMGELLSGDRLAAGKDLATFHTDFSEKLDDFAGAAKIYLNSENRGRTVYAGGDDFLGFVNLESLFEVLAHFQCKFRELVSTPMQPYLKDANGITFSAGICIAHYKEPLSLVLNRARAMEQKAKDYRKSKNAFGIAVIKGSGEDHDTVWGFENSNPAKLEYLIESLRKEHFSNTFIKNFQREFAPVLKENEQVPTTMQEMFQIELTRLAERSCDLPNKKEKAARLCKMLWTDFFLSQQSESPKATLGNF
ncbi:MAG TPA: type III-B CRISPR-associated protein Cas10/Cmr2, partial [Saprospiraceae bacterium]|nr:type III-B CRISPR-associated protein Cas10/Cmr2 [Saprospiraceae bacterium]